MIEKSEKINKAFNITEFKKEEYCESVIELKYKNTLGEIQK
jgi:hypothetical protein